MKKKKKINRGFDKKYIPLFLIGIIPLIVRSISFETDKNIPNWNIFFEEFTFDLFNFWKSVALCAIGLIILFYFIADKKKNTLKTYDTYKKTIWITLAYSISIIISTFLSDYKNVVFFGVSDRYEGLFVLLSYMLILLFVLHIIKDEYDIKYVYYAIISASIVVFLLSIWQAFGVNIFNTPLMKLLIGTSQKTIMNDNFNGNYSYATLYNPNYLAQYCVLIFGILASSLFYFKNNKSRIIISILIAACLFSAYRSHTSSAYLGFAATIAMVFLFNIKNIWKNITGKISIIIIGVAIVAGILVLSLGLVNEDILSKINTVSSVNSMTDKDIYFKSINYDKEHIRFELNDGTLDLFLSINEENNAISLVVLEDTNRIKIKKVDNTIQLEEGKYKDFIQFIVYGNSIVTEFSIINHPTFDIEMAYTNEDGFIGVVWYNDEIITDIYGSEAAILIGGNGKMFSRRLYFWVASLYNAKDNLLFGKGADTFRICFDQTDIIGKLNTQHSSVAIIDKAHNDYINILVTTGLISLLAFLLLFIAYLVNSIKIYIPKIKKSSLDIVGYIIASTIFGYLVFNIFADSYIGVAPIMYMLLGLGIVVNRINKKN